MTEEEKQEMERYGIIEERKPVFHYLDYKYEHLADALSYARRDAERRQRGGGSSVSGS